MCRPGRIVRGDPAGCKRPGRASGAWPAGAGTTRPRIPVGAQAAGYTRGTDEMAV